MLKLLMSTHKKLSLREQENAEVWSLLQRLFDSIAKCFIPGGWLLVANFVSNFTSPSRWTAESSYRGVRNFTNNKMGITVSALKELRSHLSFTQLRFHCSKKQGRTFRVTTVSNSTGEAVVEYFSGQTDVHPDSCGSFQRMEDDNSKLAMECESFFARRVLENLCALTNQFKQIPKQFLIEF